MTIDRKEFYVRLYEALGLLAFRQLSVDKDDEDDDEPGKPNNKRKKKPEDGGGAEGGGDDPFSGQEPLPVLLATTLQQMLCDTKISDVARVAAFLKRCASVALACGGSEAMVLLGVMLRLLRRYPRLLCMLEFEGEAPVAGRMFDPRCPDPSEAGALAATLWEVPVITKHFHPHVAQVGNITRV